jgi:hypothetical protein
MCRSYDDRRGSFWLFIFWILCSKNKLFQETSKHLSTACVFLIANEMLRVYSEHEAT